MNYLVTGGTGFIGKWVLRYLLKSMTPNDHIYCITRYANPELPRSKNLSALTYEIRNNSGPHTIFDRKYDKIIHMAWENIHNYNDPNHLVIKDNQQQFLLELMSKCNDLTVIGTCFEYGLANGSLNEDTPPNPITAYGKAKSQLQQKLFQYAAGKEVNIKWLRPFYVYGEGQPQSSLIPQLEKSILEGKKEFNMSPGDQIRDYIHVDQLANYIVTIAQLVNTTEIINVSSGDPISLKDFVLNYLKTNYPDYGMKLNLGYHDYRPEEPMRFWGDNSKLLNLIR